MNKKIIEKFDKLHPCKEGIEYLKSKGTIKEAWNDCERGDWLLWLLGKLSGKPGSEKRKKLVLTACACARLSLEYVKKGENRPKKAIETAEAWARNEGPTLDDVRKAADAAVNAYAADAAVNAYAAADADAADADAAAYAAAYAAANAYAAAYAAAAANAYAADAAYAAAAYAAYAAGTTARKKTLKKCAEVVRKFYPNPPTLEVKP